MIDLSMSLNCSILMPRIRKELGTHRKNKRKEDADHAEVYLYRISFDDTVSPETSYSECNMASDRSCQCCKCRMEEYVIVIYHT